MAVATNGVLAHEALGFLSMVVKNPAENVWNFWTLVVPSVVPTVRWFQWLLVQF